MWQLTYTSFFLKWSSQYSSFDHVDYINQNKNKVFRNNFNLLDANPHTINRQQRTTLGDVYTNYNYLDYTSLYTRWQPKTLSYYCRNYRAIIPVIYNTI